MKWSLHADGTARYQDWFIMAPRSGDWSFKPRKDGSFGAVSCGFLFVGIFPAWESFREVIA